MRPHFTAHLITHGAILILGQPRDHGLLTMDFGRRPVTPPPPAPGCGWDRPLDRPPTPEAAVFASASGELRAAENIVYGTNYEARKAAKAETASRAAALRGEGSPGSPGATSSSPKALRSVFFSGPRDPPAADDFVPSPVRGVSADEYDKSQGLLYNNNSDRDARLNYTKFVVELESPWRPGLFAAAAAGAGGALGPSSPMSAASSPMSGFAVTFPRSRPRRRGRGRRRSPQRRGGGGGGGGMARTTGHPGGSGGKQFSPGGGQLARRRRPRPGRGGAAGLSMLPSAQRKALQRFLDDITSKYPSLVELGDDDDDGVPGETKGGGDAIDLAAASASGTDAFALVASQRTSLSMSLSGGGGSGGGGGGSGALGSGPSVPPLGELEAYSSGFMDGWAMSRMSSIYSGGSSVLPEYSTLRAETLKDAREERAGMGGGGGGGGGDQEAWDTPRDQEPPPKKLPPLKLPLGMEELAERARAEALIARPETAATEEDPRALADALAREAAEDEDEFYEKYGQAARELIERRKTQQTLEKRVDELQHAVDDAEEAMDLLAAGDVDEAEQALEHQLRQIRTRLADTQGELSRAEQQPSGKPGRDRMATDLDLARAAQRERARMETEERDMRRFLRREKQELKRRAREARKEAKREARRREREAQRRAQEARERAERLRLHRIRQGDERAALAEHVKGERAKAAYFDGFVYPAPPAQFEEGLTVHGVAGCEMRVEAHTRKRYGKDPHMRITCDNPNGEYFELLVPLDINANTGWVVSAEHGGADRWLQLAVDPKTRKAAVEALLGNLRFRPVVLEDGTPDRRKKELLYLTDAEAERDNAEFGRKKDWRTDGGRARKAARNETAALRAVFDLIDADKGGTIDVSEVMAALRDGDKIAALVSASPKLEALKKPSTWRKAFAEIDADGDGQIDFSEFKFYCLGAGVQKPAAIKIQCFLRQRFARTRVAEVKMEVEWWRLKLPVLRWDFVDQEFFTEVNRDYLGCEPVRFTDHTIPIDREGTFGGEFGGCQLVVVAVAVTACLGKTCILLGEPDMRRGKRGEQLVVCCCRDPWNKAFSLVLRYKEVQDLLASVGVAKWLQRKRKKEPTAKLVRDDLAEIAALLALQEPPSERRKRRLVVSEAVVAQKKEAIRKREAAGKKKKQRPNKNFRSTSGRGRRTSLSRPTTASTTAPAESRPSTPGTPGGVLVEDEEETESGSGSDSD